MTRAKTTITRLGGIPASVHGRGALQLPRRATRSSLWSLRDGSVLLGPAVAASLTAEIGARAGFRLPVGNSGVGPLLEPAFRVRNGAARRVRVGQRVFLCRPLRA